MPQEHSNTLKFFHYSILSLLFLLLLLSYTDAPATVLKFLQLFPCPCEKRDGLTALWRIHTLPQHQRQAISLLALRETYIRLPSISEDRQ